MNVDGIIFDLDGTLWNSTEVVIKAWNYVTERYEKVRKPITKEALQSIMGLQVPQIGEKLFFYLDKELQKEIVNTCCQVQLGFIVKY